MSKFGKIEIDYELFTTMRNLCLDVIEQAERANDIDMDGDYRLEPYNGGIIYINKDDMEELKQLKNIL